MAEIADILVPNGARFSDAGFWGWITVGPGTVPVVAATAAHVMAPQRYTITAFNLVEELSLEWLAELCGLAPHMLGVYSSGGSVANLVALGAARQWAYEQVGVDPARDGLGRLRPVVYATEESHHTVQRSAGVLGIGRANVRMIATDDCQRMRPDALRDAVVADIAAGALPVAVVATAGTTNTGAIDPLRAIGEIAREHGVWFHVDGAYGLPGILDERVAALYDGLELADSAIVDPHKWLGAPVGVAATFVRDRSILHRAFTQEPAAYLEGSMQVSDDVRISLDAMGIPYADFGVELSATARGAQVWSVVRELGRDGARRADPLRQRPRHASRGHLARAPAPRAAHRADTLDRLLPLRRSARRRPRLAERRHPQRAAHGHAVPPVVDGGRRPPRAASVLHQLANHARHGRRVRGRRGGDRRPAARGLSPVRPSALVGGVARSASA